LVYARNATNGNILWSGSAGARPVVPSNKTSTSH
jgi:hypothetical protein